MHGTGILCSNAISSTLRLTPETKLTLATPRHVNRDVTSSHPNPCVKGIQADKIVLSEGIQYSV